MKIETSTGWFGPAADAAVGDALLEVARRERGGAVHRQRGAGRAQQERAPVHAGAGRNRLSRLDRRQAAAGLRDAAAQQL